MPKARKHETDVAKAEQMVAEFGRMAEELRYVIDQTEEKSGLRNPAHFRYPVWAKAARFRLGKLETSIGALTAEIGLAKEEANVEA